MQGHGPVVWKTAKRLLNHDADVADCFQETFVSALKLAATTRIENWPGLLRRLATARALDLLRRRIRNQRVEEMPADFSTEDDPVIHAQAGELHDQLRVALARLPAQQSEVFCLRYLNEMSYEEISREMKISIDAVGVNLHRARARLKELLNAFAAESRQR
ncbi:MAG TPA: sigma-70 family RNA polymerase sigma factor [Tepidisphaeraceae bacterium]|nr:sigma-70 family RNA polymerase sigma factor [Tepidisphaeraceae bacterium]